MEHRNVTLSLPEALLRKFRVRAATQQRSMSSLITEAIEKMLGEEEDREKAHKRLTALMKSAPLKGVKGGVKWTRDDIHER